ncbi:MAG: hypothetical protein ACD_77C00346G0040 [uncultured bacterium]|nr:MAG: hypothetical protein ACD_77C00346G0040 [uncultured bacterium]
MQFLWFDINASFSHSSLALPALEAQLSVSQRERIKWQVVNGTIKSDPSTCLLNIIKFTPDVIFATLWLFNHNFVMSVLKKAHILNLDIKIILGGPEFLGDNYIFLRNNPEVSAVFRGEGEEIFPEFVESFLNFEEWKSIKGICFIDDSGLYHDKQTVYVNDFKKLTPPENSEFFNWDKPFIQIETSRSCFNTCKFCISGKTCVKTENIPVDSLRKRLNTIKDKGIREVRILDRTFNANPARAIELLSLFEEYSSYIQFHLEVHPSFLTPKLREKILKITEGLLHVEVGIQSLDDNVLKISGRKGSAGKSLEGLKFLVGTNKFIVHADLIAGLPSYSFKQLMHDLISLIDAGPDEIQIESLKGLPGTEFRENSLQFGIVFSECPPYEVLKTSCISTEELLMASYLSRLTDIWYNNPKWQLFLRKNVKLDNEFLEKFLHYNIENHSLNQTMSLDNSGLILYEFCEKYYFNSLGDLTEAWVIAGLSLKKKPATGVKKWKYGRDTALVNPLLINFNTKNTYYYLECSDKIIWFEFENTIRGAVPSKSVTVKF